VAGLGEVARQWTRIGATGFGGPPAHISLLRELCVQRRRWLDDAQFEDAIAATNLLPGPASTQLAIFCAWRVGGVPGALVGGAGFILPGLVLIIALAVLFLSGAPPVWVLGAGAGAGAAVAAVAVQAGTSLLPASWRRATGDERGRWVVYVLLGGLAAATVGPWLVLVLLAAGVAELAWRHGLGSSTGALHAWPLGAVAAIAATGGLGALAWTAVAFLPSFSFILLGAERFDRLAASARVRAFLDGAGPAAIGAIAGSAVPLALALSQRWQAAVLIAAAIALLVLRRGVVQTLLSAGTIGAVAALAGAPLPG